MQDTSHGNQWFAAAVSLMGLVFVCLLAGCRSTKPARIDDITAVSLSTNGDAAIAGDSHVDRLRRTPALAPDIQFVSHSVDAQLPPEPVSLPEPEPPSTEGLTLEYLEQLALNNNPTLAEASARVSAIRGKWLQVGLPPNTQIGYSGQQLGSGGLAEQQGLFAGQEFIRGGKLRLNRAIVAQEIQRAEHLLAAQRQRVLTDLRLGFYEILISQRRISVSLRLVRTAEEAATTAQSLYDASEVSQVDVMRARVQLQLARLLAKTSRNQRAAAWKRLATVLGVRDFEPQPLVADLEREIPNIQQDDALVRLLARSPEMAVALAEVERARWSVERAMAEPKPDLEVQAIAQSDNGTNSSNANLQVALPIPWLNRNQGGIRQARARLAAAQQNVARLELSLEHRLANVYKNYDSARQQVSDYSRPGGIIANSDAALRLIESAYEAGEVGYLELLTAQETSARTNLSYIDALADLWAAIAEIDGLLLKGSFERGPTAEME